MSTLVYMKMLERTPADYDRGMRILTLSRIDRVKREIAGSWVEPGHEVLEIGCGTGTLAALMIARGARVVGIDISEDMLAEARKNAPEAEILHLTATEIDRFEPERFDRSVATLSFSELSRDEPDHALRAASGGLKPDGMLVVADEVPASRWGKRVLAGFVRWPLAALTFLLTRSTTRALRAFEEQLQRTGFQVTSDHRFLLGTLALIVAERS